MTGGALSPPPGDDDLGGYRSLFENAVEGIYRTTPDGRYLDANPALARIYGYDGPADLIAGLTDIAHDLYVNPTDRDRFKESLDRDSVVRNFEARVYGKNRDIIWISENARAVRTASSEQVRRPVNRDGVDQWKPYAQWLAPLQDALGDALETWRD